VGEVEGLAHEDLAPPDVADPEDVPPPPPEPPPEPGEDRPRYAFWDNFDQRPLTWVQPWPPVEPLPPVYRTWVRYMEGSAGTGTDGATPDPWVDAARLLVVLDVGSWPAGSRPHAYREHAFIAPSLDLYAAFTDLGSGSEWLLLDAHSPVAASGLLSWTGRVWSRDRRLVASGGGQAVFRKMSAGARGLLNPRTLGCRSSPLLRRATRKGHCPITGDGSGSRSPVPGVRPSRATWRTSKLSSRALSPAPPGATDHASRRSSSGMVGFRCNQHSPEWCVVRFLHRRRPRRASVKGTNT
jgi:hypothetical protein